MFLEGLATPDFPLFQGMAEYWLMYADHVGQMLSNTKKVGNLEILQRGLEAVEDPQEAKIITRKIAEIESRIYEYNKNKFWRDTNKKIGYYERDPHTSKCVRFVFNNKIKIIPTGSNTELSEEELRAQRWQKTHIAEEQLRRLQQLENEKKDNWGRSDTSRSNSTRSTASLNNNTKGSLKSISSIDEIPDLPENFGLPVTKEPTIKPSPTFTEPIPPAVIDPFGFDTPSRPIEKGDPTLDLFTPDISQGISKGMASLLSGNPVKENIPPSFPSPFEFSSRVKRNSGVLTPNCPKNAKKVTKCNEVRFLELKKTIF